MSATALFDLLRNYPHAVVDPAGTGVLEEGKGLVVCVELHFLRLARKGTHERMATFAVTGSIYVKDKSPRPQLHFDWKKTGTLASFPEEQTTPAVRQRGIQGRSQSISSCEKVALLH